MISCFSWWFLMMSPISLILNYNTFIWIVLSLLYLNYHKCNLIWYILCRKRAKCRLWRAVNFILRTKNIYKLFIRERKYLFNLRLWMTGFIIQSLKLKSTYTEHMFQIKVRLVSKRGMKYIEPCIFYLISSSPGVSSTLITLWKSEQSPYMCSKDDQFEVSDWGPLHS